MSRPRFGLRIPVVETLIGVRPSDCPVLSSSPTNPLESKSSETVRVLILPYMAIPNVSNPKRQIRHGYPESRVRKAAETLRIRLL